MGGKGRWTGKGGNGKGGEGLPDPKTSIGGIQLVWRTLSNYRIEVPNPKTTLPNLANRLGSVVVRASD